MTAATTTTHVAEHARLLRDVGASYESALAWLERVGSWPSSDAGVAEITRAAERRVSRGR